MKPLQISVRILLCAGLSIFTLLEISVFGAPQARPISGPEVYQKRCASCHDQASSGAPPREALQNFSATRILRILDFGLMMGVAYPMKRDEREAVASFLGTGAADAAPPASAFCAAGSHALSGPQKGNWNGWSPSDTNTRYQTAEEAALTANQIRHLKLKWAFGFSGDITAFAAPTVLDGTLFMGSAAGVVQAVNARTGCLYWVFGANGPVRSAIRVVGDGSSYSLIVTDLNGGVYSLEAKTGRLLWKRRVDDHEAARLTGSPVAFNGVVYVPAASWEETRALDPHYECCTFRGSLTALRVRDGSVVWKTHMIDPPKKTGVNGAGTTQWGPSGAGIWSAPTIDTKRGVLYVTTGDNYPATGEYLTREGFLRYRKMGGAIIIPATTPEMVRAAIADPLTMIASDGRLVGGTGHPRTAGSYARVLGEYVRQENALSLMDAIRKMTLMPAQRLEKRAPIFRDKGRLRVGADADITVFDPDKVIDKATYEKPSQYSEGIQFVFVNGTLVVKEGKLVQGVLPGRAARAPVMSTN
jgi:PQQ-like domain/Amidohydrolase family